MPSLPPWQLDDEVEDTDGPWHLRALKLNSLHEAGLTGAGVKVAVIDSGVDSQNAEFESSAIEIAFVRGTGGFDSNGHGTAMVGVVVGASGGVAPGAKLLSVRAVSATGNASSNDIANGLRLAMKSGADVISISVMDTAPEARLTQAVTEAINAGCVVVAAAGNDVDGTFRSAYPASLTPVIAVTALDEGGELVYAAPPTWVDVAAPGANILTATLTGTGYITGTSPATAVVAGVCALLLSLASSPAERRSLARHIPALLRSSGRSLASSTGPGDCVSVWPIRAVKEVKQWLVGRA